MFKFNFNVEETNNTDLPEETTIHQELENNNENNFNQYGIADYSEYESIENNDINFKKLFLNEQNTQFIEYVDSYTVKMDENDELNQINKTHDLVAGTYEGGLKVWELSIDLARFIYNLESSCIKPFFEQFLCSSSNELNILELGCGHSLPTLGVLKYLIDNIDNHLKSSPLIVNIYLQDFNKQIIETITLKNIKRFLNCNYNNDINSKSINLNFKFIWGDWSKLSEILPANYFNLILTSETIYNKKNYFKLLNLFKNCLLSLENTNKPSFNAIILLAQKTYYFGCGGNLHEFLNVAKSVDYKFNFTSNLLSSLNDRDNDNTSSQNSDSSSCLTKEIIKLYFK